MRALVLGLACALVATACERGCARKPAAAAETTGTAAAKPPARTTIAIHLPNGQQTARLEPEDGGYVLVDNAGWPIGRVRIGPSNVVVVGRSGEPLCTARADANGFVLDDGGDAPRLVGRETEVGVVVERTGLQVGQLTDGSLFAEGAELSATAAGEYTQVTVDEQRVLELRGFSHEAAAWLAYTELTFPERVAMMFLHAERL